MHVVKWKKTEEMVIQLDPEEFEQADNIPGEGHEDHSGKGVQQQDDGDFSRI